MSNHVAPELRRNRRVSALLTQTEFEALSRFAAETRCTLSHAVGLAVHAVLKAHEEESA